MFLLGIFAALALILTAIGIYGVVSYSVAQLTREIGVRIALGAPRKSVLFLMLRKGLVLGASGVGIGGAGALVLTRVIASQLFGVSPTDPATFGGVASFIMLVTVLACYVPAMRATRVDPMTALRCE